jgi:hypothetical protein
MRAREFLNLNKNLNELFDTTIPIKWMQYGSAHTRIASFVVDGFRYHSIFSLIGTYRYEWVFELDFNYKKAKHIDATDSLGIIGTGNASIVFSAALATLIAFIKKQSPYEIEFSAEEDSRKKLYDTMVRRLAGKLPKGYKIEPITYGSWVIKKDALKENALMELFKWKWEKKEISLWTAKFDIRNIPYYVSFSGSSAVSITFAAMTNGRTGAPQVITGNGSAQKIFATVIQIIKAFIAERQPYQFGFEAHKNQPSKVSLYRKMIGALGNVPGYKFEENPHHDSVSFLFKRTDGNNIPNDKVLFFDSLKENTLLELSRPSRAIADRILLKAGYKVLGNGGFGTVYQKPGVNYVLKTFEAQDDAYKAYIVLCQQHANEHFPRFFGNLIKVTGDYYAIRTEFLTPFRGNSDYLFVYMKYRDYVKDNPNGHIANIFYDAMDQLEQQPSLLAACDLIIDNLSDFDLDIADRNVMMRGSTIVLTDPIQTLVFS